MGRIHLFEFEDLQWFPSFLRNYGTDFLHFLSNKMKIYRGVVPLFSKALQNHSSKKIVDLGSGGGGGWPWLNDQLRKDHPDLKIILTDYYPNLAAFEHIKKGAPNFEYIARSVDARDVPSNLSGIRTLFLLLHHFKPQDAQQILQNAVDSMSPILVIEAQDRSLPSMLGMLISPISVLVTTPFIRPFKIGRIIFTYLIPIVPLFVIWDGIVSVLRTYSIKEMNHLKDNLTKAGAFTWDIGKVKTGPTVILYLYGAPKGNSS